MLRPDFTHVGIGVTTHAPYGPKELLATLIFSRRPSLGEALWSDQDALAALIGFRERQGQPTPLEDESLLEAAKAGMQAFVDRNVSKEAAIDESARQLADTRGVCAAFVEILELEQLKTFPAVHDPNLEALAVSLTARAEGERVVLHVLMLFKARPGASVACE
jgi:hypothetical protein